MKYYVCVTYTDNSRPFDDNARGYYDRTFDTKRAAWDYIQKVGQHAEAKPYMMIDVLVVESVNYRHVWRNIWNAR